MTILRNGFLCLLTLVLCAPLFAQMQISEENYWKQDSLLWSVEYPRETNPIYEQIKGKPEKADSLYDVLNAINDNFDRKNIELAKQFFSVPGGLQRLYMTRLSIDKDTLRDLVSRLPDSLSSSDYARWIRWHVDSKQVEAGDRCVEYDCMTLDGKPFDWESIKGKHCLLIYGGMSCMGSSGRRYLQKLMDTTSRDNLVIITHWPLESLEEVKKAHDHYKLSITSVSDLKREGSPIQVVYGSQAQPTCFMIGPDGIVRLKTRGLDSRRFDDYLRKEDVISQE